MLFKISVDCVILGYDSLKSKLKILLIKRVNEPQKDMWALPGGFVKKTESFNTTAGNILLRETGLEKIYLRQLKAYSLTDISANNRIASVAYYSFIKFDDVMQSSSGHVSKWFEIKEIPPLPFDHEKKVEFTITKIKELIKLEPVLFYLLPLDFPLNQLQKFYEELYGIKIDNRNFRKKIQKLSYIEKLDKMEKNVPHRPARLYRFNLEKYQKDAKVV